MAGGTEGHQVEISAIPLLVVDVSNGESSLMGIEGLSRAAALLATILTDPAHSIL